MRKSNILIASLLLSVLSAPAYSERIDVGITEALNISGQTLEGYTFTNGGAIYNAAADTTGTYAGLTLSNNTKIINNTADINGGGIYNTGNLITDLSTLFENNTANANKATNTIKASPQGCGGAIFNEASQATTIAGTFKNNKANGYGTYGGGGAIYNAANSQTLTIASGSYFENNYAQGNGGAIFNASAEGLSIDYTKFVSNYVKSSSGGAINFNAGNNTGKLTITNSEFDSNHSNIAGGAILTTANETIIENSKFYNNYTTNSSTSKGYGGGAILAKNAGSMKISDSLFDSNTTKSKGGAVNFDNSTTPPASSSLEITNTQFSGNKASNAGGNIYIKEVTNTKIENSSIKDGSLTNVKDASGAGIYFENSTTPSTFDLINSVITGNKTNEKGTQRGGGIYYSAVDTASVINITGSEISNNTANTAGAGMVFKSPGTANINSTLFSNNTVTNGNEGGGAMYLLGDGTVNISNTGFSSNAVSGYGGAINIAQDTTLNIKENSFFEGNSASIAGGAISQADGSFGKITINKAVFENNTAFAEGGAITSDNILNITNSTFTGNKTTSTQTGTTVNDNDDGGGAIMLYDQSVATIVGSTFTGNTSGTYGGAISTRLGADNSSLTVESSNFTGNSAGVNGGAICANINAVITDSNFINNSAAENGGAIWAKQDLTVNAVSSDVVFSGNNAAAGGDIYLDTAGSNLNLNAAADKSIIFTGGVSGEKYNINVNSDSANTGTIVINSAIQNASINVANGTFHLSTGSALDNSTLNMVSGTTLNTINNEVNSFGSNLTIADNVNLAIDVNLSNGQADNFDQAVRGGGVTVVEINPLGAANTTANNISINLAEALGINSNDLTISSALINQTQTVLTPIRYLQGGVTADGILSFAPTGNSYKDYNPAVMASPVAAQLGGYLTQLNSYDEAFRNMDMYMLMTKEQRNVLKMRNRYAIQDSNVTYQDGVENTVWTRPYATFENVHLRGGARVSNVAYGSFFGGESKLYDLGHGWDGMWGIYAGYNGSHQAFNGIGIYQNGGTLGAVGMAYKGNFFTGLTINAGANGGEASTMYGNDNFSMLMAGIASKTGYNIEMAKGRFIIQPSFLMSYSFVNTFDYTNAAGVKISSDPLNAIHLEPGLKFIGNLKNGWQPYLGVSMVWNIMDKTDFHANNVSLPDLSVKPYVKYGVGVRKSWGERLTGFFQCYFTNGGRNGVGLQAGFKWAIGKDSSVPTVNKTPELKKTEIKLSCSK